MKDKMLIQTNIHLRDPVLREKLIARSVRTSCDVEGIVASNNPTPIEISRRSEKRIYKTMDR